MFIASRVGEDWRVQAELDRLGDGGFEEFGNISVKGEAHDTGLSVVVNVKAEVPSANRGGSDFIEEFKGGFEVVVVSQTRQCILCRNRQQQG